MTRRGTGAAPAPAGRDLIIAAEPLFFPTPPLRGEAIHQSDKSSPVLPPRVTVREMEVLLDRLAIEMEAMGRKAVVLVPIYDRLEGAIVRRLREDAVLDSARARVRRLKGRTAVR